MVFQQFNLFPHLTVLQKCDIKPYLGEENWQKGEAESEALALLERVGIEEHAHKFPTQIFGRATTSVWQLQGLWQCSPKLCYSTSRQAPLTLR